MKKHIFFIAIFLFAGFLSLHAQDTIVTRGRQVIPAHVLEMSDKYVKYRAADNPDAPVIMLRTQEVRKIKFSNGEKTELMNVNPRFRRPFGINAGLALRTSYDGGGYWDINAEYFIIPQIAMVAEVGNDMEDEFFFMAGARYHVNRNFTRTGFTPFIGLLAGNFSSTGLVQLPIGINYLARFGLNISFSINQMYYFNDHYVETYAELKLGWHF